MLEIQSHLQEMYGAEVSPTLISSVTDAVMDEAKARQVRPLKAVYPIVYLDCIHVKTRDAGAVRAKAVYLALGFEPMRNFSLPVYAKMQEFQSPRLHLRNLLLQAPYS